MADCERNLRRCGLRPLVVELRKNADDDVEAEVTDSWVELMEAHEADGDGMDYDGDATTW
jgi:hypothetical protein